MPRIAFFSQHWPNQTTFGSEQRAFHIKRALEEIGKVDVIVLDVEAEAAQFSEQNQSRIVDVVTVHDHDNKNIYQKLRWACNPYTHHPHGKATDNETLHRILKLIRDYDLIWFNKMRTASMFGHWTWPQSILDIDDLSSLFEESVLQNAGNFSGRLMTKIRRSNWRRRERLLGERFNALAVCSEADRQYLESLGITAPVHVIPNGFEKPLVEPERAIANPPRIGFIGQFHYPPNYEGVRWFADECWPRIKATIPDARLRLVGRSTDGSLKPNGVDIDGLGWMDDPAPEIATWSAMIVPIRTGAGTRVKIAEAFGRKCPLVSTRLGAFGYDVKNGEELCLADSPEDFAGACVRLIQHAADGAEMAERAWQRFLTQWTWEAIAPRVWAAAENVLRGREGSLQSHRNPIHAND